MKIYTTLQIGEFHINYCEDFLIKEQLTSHEILIAVLDGCTMGTESVFASILYGKILRKVAKNKFYEEFIAKQNQEINLQLKLKSILQELIYETREIKNNLGLETNELLSTIILGIIDTKNYKAELITIGDGLICIDRKIIEYEQNNTPDYLGYHLTENFEDFYKNQQQKLSISSFTDLSISTDGIFTFKNLENQNLQKKESEIIDYLLIDNNESEFDNFLDRKIRNLKKINHVVTDDLAIIRIKKNK
ncbi:Stage II sporulation protein E (SpoIIE) [Bernardetia litoralis DSM 6794]|uniref:Stage II sporulation protein E (SpoIIE) n=1 Tax=Bernardetia litoralis (strain ATCC 23117 / DSM 6794 / NBRC 15988 / NCIMB 1366 / Fx l1 / Sio-4) TaxID=880071 RepID=I4AMK6_BERLS|nr:protein phosphatase 2C domain-containing protein [Bernardetia litoralis]AFM05191.1 Stage II sporulation protein E (SpoIIE) [Bernardetia litoralis DSM 6794]